MDQTTGCWKPEKDVGLHKRILESKKLHWTP
jgi:hypothetical protein